MNTLVVRNDVNTFKILGSAEELLEIVMLLSNSSLLVELGFELGLTILASRLKTQEFVFSQVKNVLFGEIQNLVRRHRDRDYSEFDKWSKSNFDANFDEVSIEQWADRLDKLVK